MAATWIPQFHEGDAGTTGTDFLVPMLGRRNDSLAVRADTDGKYGSIAIDQYGRVVITGTITATASGTQDVNIIQVLGAAHSATNPIFVQQSTAAVFPVSDGGSSLSIDDGGNVITVDGTVAFSNTTIAVTNDGTFAVQAVVTATNLDIRDLAFATDKVDASGSAVTAVVTNAGTFAVQAAATLAAETTKVIGTVNQGTSPWVISGAVTRLPVPASTVSGTLDLTNVASTVSASSGGYSFVLIHIAAGTTAGASVIFEASNDNFVTAANTFTVHALSTTNQSSTSAASPNVAITSAQAYLLPCRGFQNIRVRVVVSVGSGTAAVTLELTEMPSPVINVQSIMPGIAAASLGKAEDAAHVSGDTGVAIWSVRNDTYQTRASADTDYNAIATNAGGATMVANAGSQITSYSAANSEVALASTPTHIFTIAGSASKTIRITKVRVALYETAATIRLVKILKLSSAPTGGTSGAMTAIPHDSANAAATASPLQWTANPTGGGTSLGSIDELDVETGIAAGAVGAVAAEAPSQYYNTWSDLITQPITLRGTAQCLSVNLGGAALDAGRKASFYIEWTEDAV